MPVSAARRLAISAQRSTACSRALSADGSTSSPVDRLGRSLTDLLATLGELHAKGVDLYLHQQGIDTTTPAGKAMFQMMAVFAEFERSMIVERVKSGTARARVTGTKSGKPIGRAPTSPQIESAIRKTLAGGTGIIKTAKLHKVGVSVVQRIKAAA